MNNSQPDSVIKNVVAENIDDHVATQLTPEIKDYLSATKGVSPDNPIAFKTIDAIFKDQPHILAGLKEDGVATIVGATGTVVLGAGFDVEGNLISTAAAIPRLPGKSEDFLSEVADFSSSTADRTTLLELYENVYHREGVVNNAINKSAALVATNGKFKVRYVKGQRGISGDAKAEELRLLLQFWVENVNARAEDGPVSGARGLKAFMSQGVRLALKQGDHFGRQIWSDAEVPVLKGKRFQLPLGLQTFDARTIEIPEGLEGTDIELFYWVPPREFVQTLTDPEDPNIKEQLDRLIPSDVKSALIADGKYLLDPALMVHIKHRGTATTNYGESMIEPAMNEIAYKRALQALDMVTIENLINRLVIIMVGSDKPESIYHKQEVSSSRMKMLSNMLSRIGPSATIIWPGPDIKIEEVGAFDSILDTDTRYQQVEERIKGALGVPSALLTGDTGAGKAAGWASILGLAAELAEVQDQYKQAFKTIAERIALENGYEDVDVVWEFNQALLTNQENHVEMILDSFKVGAISFQTMLEELGFDFDAELIRMQDDIDNDRRDDLFGPPRALDTQNNLGGESPEGTSGRPKTPNKKDPRKDKETKTPTENK